MGEKWQWVMTFLPPLYMCKTKTQEIWQKAKKIIIEKTRERKIRSIEREVKRGI